MKLSELIEVFCKIDSVCEGDPEVEFALEDDPNIKFDLTRAQMEGTIETTMERGCLERFPGWSEEITFYLDDRGSQEIQK
jgi:hypothetical protein